MVDKRNKGGISLVLRCSTTIRGNSTCTFYAKLRRSKRDSMWYICQGFSRSHTCGGDGLNKLRHLPHMLNLWATDRVRRKDNFRISSVVAVKYLKDGEAALKRLVHGVTSATTGHNHDALSTSTQQQSTDRPSQENASVIRAQLPHLLKISSEGSDAISSRSSGHDDETITPISTSLTMTASRSTRINVS